MAGLLEEVCTLLERAPIKYVADPGTASIRQLTEAVHETIPYFWFIFNAAPPYDKFNWAIHHATEEQLATYGGFVGVPNELVPFNQEIYDNFRNGLRGWSNARCGIYTPPIAGFRS